MSRALTFNSLYSHLLKVFYKYITHSQAKGNNKGFSSKEEVRKPEIEVLALLNGYNNAENASKLL